MKIKNIETGEVKNWTLKEVLEEINRDHSDEWIDYDEKDWEEGWNEWVEGDFYTLIMTKTQSATEKETNIKHLFRYIELSQRSDGVTEELIGAEGLCLEYMTVLYSDERVAIIKYSESGDFLNIIDLYTEELITTIEPL